MQHHVTTQHTFTHPHTQAHAKRKDFIRQNLIKDDAKSPPDETNNCTVIAFSTAFRIPYQTTYRIAEQAGRKHNDGFWIHRIIREAKQKLELSYDYIIPQKGKTIYSFLKDNPQGRYIITIRNHALAVINGKIHDTIEVPPKSRIVSIYKIKATIKDYVLQNNSY